jgi:hypothetical protein
MKWCCRSSVDVDLYQSLEANFDRAVLQLLFRDILGVDNLEAIGRFPQREVRRSFGDSPQTKTIAFAQYALRVLTTVAERNGKALPERSVLRAAVEHAYIAHRYGNFNEGVSSLTWRSMGALWMLKATIGHVIEAILLVDRCLYVNEQCNSVEARLVPVFDPTASPRCFAVIAEKRSMQSA